MTYTMKLGSTADEVVIRDADHEFLWPGKDGWDAYLSWRAAGNSPTPAEPPIETIPTQISRRQFFQAYAQEFPEDMTQEEALGAASAGVLPKLFETAVIPQAPEADRFALKMYVASSLYFDRDNPHMVFIMGRLGMGGEQADLFFSIASKL